jgi:hypothetical protein
MMWISVKESLPGSDRKYDYFFITNGYGICIAQKQSRFTEVFQCIACGNENCVDGDPEYPLADTFTYWADAKEALDFLPYTHLRNI